MNDKGTCVETHEFSFYYAKNNPLRVKDKNTKGGFTYGKIK